MSRNKLRVKMSRLKWNEVVHTLNVGADKTLEIKSNSFIFFCGFFLLLHYHLQVQPNPEKIVQ